ncbi:MAG: GDP-mannose 4,6-dehydratase, partial [Patescibacteria group bacterium]
MKILVTGASGFAGSHLVEALKAVGQSDIYGTAYGNSGYLATLLPQDHIIKVNLTDAEATSTLVEKVQPDQIYHLAAFAFVGESFDRAAELMQNNVTLQLNMLEAVRKHTPKAKLLVIGSAEEYGLSTDKKEKINEDHPLQPVNPYAVSKIAQDLLGYSYQVSYGLNILRVRPFNHIGERQTPDFAIPAFAKQIVEVEQGKSNSLKVGNLDGVRDFTDVKDMVRAYITVIEKGKVG